MRHDVAISVGRNHERREQGSLSLSLSCLFFSPHTRSNPREVPSQRYIFTHSIFTFEISPQDTMRFFRHFFRPRAAMRALTPMDRNIVSGLSIGL